MMTKFTITAKDVTDFVNNHFSSEYLVNFIKGLMKSFVNWSFKRVKSRPNTFDFKRIESLNYLFFIKFSKLLLNKTL